MFKDIKLKLSMLLLKKKSFTYKKPVKYLHNFVANFMQKLSSRANRCL